MATVFEHQAPSGRWEAYNHKLASIIERAMALNPASGFVHLPDIPFEVRWGANATSQKMPHAPPTGMIQVNRNSGNTRIVRSSAGPVPVGTVSGTVPTAPMAVAMPAPSVAMPVAAAFSFSHQAPNGTWEPYKPEQCVLVANAMAQAPQGGRAALPGIPFEVRWGTEACSAKWSVAPDTGILQVNVKTENTRLVRKEAPQAPPTAHPAPAAQPTPAAPSVYPNMGVPMGLPVSSMPTAGVPVGSTAPPVMAGVPMGAAVPAPPPMGAAVPPQAPTLADMADRFKRELGVSSSSVAGVVDAAVVTIGGAALQSQTAGMNCMEKAQRVYQALGW